MAQRHVVVKPGETDGSGLGDIDLFAVRFIIFVSFQGSGRFSFIGRHGQVFTATDRRVQKGTGD